MIKYFFAFITILTLLSCEKLEINKIDLAGEWRYELDRENIGKKEQWFSQELEKTLLLPAALRDNNIGDIPDLNTKWTGGIYDSSWYFNPKMEKYRTKDNMKFPFWLTPVKRYVGSAWYQKEIEIPIDWKNKTITLFLERPHWQTSVWIDTLFLGNQNSLSIPHSFTFDCKNIKPGKNRITIRVDNAIRDIDPGMNSHSISDHTQGNWNGIVGEMKLEVQNRNNIGLVRLQPDLNSKSVHAKISINTTSEQKDLKLKIQVKDDEMEDVTPPLVISINSENDLIETNVMLGEKIKLWDEFNPHLYSMKLTLSNDNEIIDVHEETFGMREFAINDKHFEINGTPIFLRGTTECSVFPLTGHPPTEEAEWARIFSICQSYGLNHMRFHSYCPPEAAFIAADKAGIYLQVEGPSWAKYSVTLGDGKPLDAYLMEETKRIIDTYGNHPSFCMMAYGNEPSGNYVPYLENWVDHFKEYDPQRLFTGASTGRSWAIIENSEFIVRSPPRGLEWKNKRPESNFDYRDKTENQQRPYITFEMGQWCVFPNFNEIPKYTGALKAKNFELFQEDLNDHYMGDQANDFLMASGKLQASCYKQEIEATLRTPNLAGFQLLSLNDFSGQGTALVGVLDAFWEEKGYITADEFKMFCNKVVPLVRLTKYTFSNTEELIASIDVANHSGAILQNAKINWQLLNENGDILKSSTSENKDVVVGFNDNVLELKQALDFVDRPEKLTLKVSVNSFINQWNIWVYPKTEKKIETKDIHITKQLDKKSLDVLEDGGKVLLLAAGKIENGKDVKQYFTPAFWNTSWFRMRPPHTTGMFINNDHPIFKDFPSDNYSDLQWWELVNRQQVINLENFPSDFRPIVQPIDTWFLNRRLAMLFEANVLNGKLMVSSMDLQNKGKEESIVSDQMYLSIVDYMKSNNFNPENKIEVSIIEELFEEKEREVWKSYVGSNP